MMQLYETFVKESCCHTTNIGSPYTRMYLVLDNRSAHPDAEIIICRLPPNSASLIQAQDQGIIKSLKCFY